MPEPEIEESVENLNLFLDNTEKIHETENSFKSENNFETENTFGMLHEEMDLDADDLIERDYNEVILLEEEYV